MTNTTVDNSQRTAAKVTGFSCLFAMAIVVFANQEQEQEQGQGEEADDMTTDNKTIDRRQQDLITVE